MSWIEELKEVLEAFATLAVVQHGSNNHKDHHPLIVGGKEVIESSASCNSCSNSNNNASSLLEFTNNAYHNTKYNSKNPIVAAVIERSHNCNSRQ